MKKLLASKTAKELFSDLQEVSTKQPPSVTALSGTLSSSYNELYLDDIKDLFKGFLTAEYLVMIEKYDSADVDVGDDYLEHWFTFGNGNNVGYGVDTFRGTELYDMCSETRDLWLDDDVDGTIYEDWLDSVESDGFNLLDVPEKLKTEEMCYTAVSGFISGDAWQILKSIPKKLLTYDLCWQAASRWGNVFDGIPKELLTEEICIMAVRHGKDIGDEYWTWVPDSHRTKAVFLEAIDNSIINDEAEFFSCIPDELWKDSEVMKRASYETSDIGEFGEYVPKHLWDDIDFCRMAVECCGYNLSFVPENLRTLEICVAAIKYLMQNDPGAVEDYFEYIPESIHNEVRKIAGITPA